LQTVESEPLGLVLSETETCVHCRSEKRTEDIESYITQYNDLLCRYDDMWGDYEKSVCEVSALKIQLRKISPRPPQEVSSLREKNALLRKENDELRSQISLKDSEQESLRQRCASLEEMNRQLRAQFAQTQNYQQSANIARGPIETPKPARTGTRQLRRKGRVNPIEEIIIHTQIYLDPTLGGYAKENNLIAGA